MGTQIYLGKPPAHIEAWIKSNVKTCTVMNRMTSDMINIAPGTEAENLSFRLENQETKIRYNVAWRGNAVIPAGRYTLWKNWGGLVNKPGMPTCLNGVPIEKIEDSSRAAIKNLEFIADEEYTIGPGSNEYY